MITGTLLLSLAGCIESSIGEVPKPPVATPPDIPVDDRGEPPDWNDCQGGYIARYSNLTIDHPDVNPPANEDEPIRLEKDWWDHVAYEDYTPSLDFGANWWPVDEGLEGDPAYFSAHFSAWIRAWDDTTVTYTLGSSDDVWILIGDEEIVAEPGTRVFDPETGSFYLDAGQYPIDVYYAHRTGGSGLRFRVLTGDVSICYGAFDIE